ncbi:unnamed protein product [Linum trigynum]|uniref:Uncharacterized protein n=1 Tax=Linum trigynum TaxID=586398 RepID=A0AAV2CSX9_9ROSI
MVEARELRKEREFSGLEKIRVGLQLGLGFNFKGQEVEVVSAAVLAEAACDINEKEAETAHPPTGTEKGTLQF